MSLKGISQAHALAKAMKTTKSAKEEDVGPELIVSSPLTRALRTALIVFNEEEKRIVVHPGFAELNHRRPIPENKGRSVREILKDDSLIRLGLTTKVDLSHAEDLDWPRSSTMDGLEFLRSRPETRIVCFSHHNYILRQFDTYLPYGVPNCEPIHAIIEFYASSGHRVRLAETPHAWCNPFEVEDEDL